MPNRFLGLDGLRALAALLIFGLHAQWPGFRGGYLGVDIFFVLSGFLITRNLAREIDLTGTVQLSKFYWRRIVRLFPPLLTTTCVIAIVHCVVIGQKAIFSSGSIWRDEVAPSLLYISNWTRSFLGQVPGTLGHTWSLSAEEQYYLLWPLLLICLLKAGRRRAVCILLLAAIAVVLWRAHLINSEISFTRIYHALDTRSDGLLVGSALGLLPDEQLRSVARFWLIGLLAVISPIATVANFQWSVAMTVLGAAIVIAKLASDQTCLLSRCLSLQPLVWLGQVSYAFYLWHFPILIIFGAFSVPYTWLYAFVFSIVGAAGSWRYVEIPASRYKSGIPSSALTRPSAG